MKEADLDKIVENTGRLGLFFAALFVVVALLNDTHSGKGALTLEIMNVLWFYLFIYRVHRQHRGTLYSHFFVVNGGLISLGIMLGSLAGFLTIEAFYQGHIGWRSLIALGLLAIHQAYRGIRSALRRWGSAEDVRRTLSPTSLARARQLPKGYDVTFFGAVAIASSALGRVVGDSVPVLLTATLYMLAFPYLFGAIAMGHVLLRRYFPTDQPFALQS
ncbi:MAG TPA: hypothetical protein VJQ47_04095 [Steroidobacteraceae bacterium]|nr:hypothetical protein [Steroidobacteraceae bacterium]